MSYVDPRGLDGWLVIIAKGDSGIGGHAAIAYFPLNSSEPVSPSCDCNTYSFFPPSIYPFIEDIGQERFVGLNENLEGDLSMVQKRNEEGYSTRKMYLNDQQEEKLHRMLRHAKNDLYTPILPLGYQCTEFAHSVWNQFSDHKVYGWRLFKLRESIDRVPQLRGPFK